MAHKYADAFDDRVSVWTELLRNLVDETSYADVLGFFQYVLRHRARPAGFAVKLEAALTASRSAYRVVGGDTIMPIGSEGEAAALNRAFSDLDDTRMKGARAHLAEAGLALTQGHWSDSVRESMQAVESVVRRLSQTNSVNDALKRLASKGHINPNMSAGLG